MASPRAWSFLAVEGSRQYGGNAGYADDPDKLYRYDSDVANHLQVRAGDVAVLRSKTEVLGIAEIESIAEGTGAKARLRCPVCRVTNIKERVTRALRYSCKNGHEFDVPETESVTVETFEAHYKNTFRPTPADLTIARLHAAVLRPSDQMSIKEIDLARIEKWIGTEKERRSLIDRYIAAMSPESPATNDEQDSATSNIELQRRVLREITLRRGQTGFRNRLMKRYGAACQISRCAFPGLIEAAHIRPYSLTNDNSANNGLLLRSDLHTLFDLGLLGVHPENLAVTLHPAVISSGYELLNDVPIFLNDSTGPDLSALQERWDFFQLKLQSKS